MHVRERQSFSTRPAGNPGRGSRVYLLGIAAAFATAVACVAPASAQASGCTNRWMNNKGGSWYEGANWSKGSVPAAGEEVCITETGTYTVALAPTTTIPTLASLTIGGTSGTQTLAVEDTCGANAALTVSEGIAIGAHGALTMTDAELCGNNDTVTANVTNAGTFSVEASHGGARTIAGSISNIGTLAVNQPTTFNGSKATLTNEGAVDVATGDSLTLNNSNTFSNLAGTIDVAGTGELVMSGGGETFNQGGGSETGTGAVYLEDLSLNYAGAGAGTLDLRGVSSVSGNVGAGQLLTIESTCGKNALATWAKGFTNTSTITLTNADECGNSEELAVTEGTLLNEGKINVEAGVGGSRTLQANIVNKGTLAIDRSTTFNTSKAVFTNEGSVTIASGAVFSFPSSNTINSNSGSFAASGTGYLVMSGGGDIFNQGAGDETGAPVYVEDGTLNYLGAGTATVDLRGVSSVSGNVGAGQLLTIESTCGKNALATWAKGFTNTSTITLTNADECGNSEELAVTEGTLLNEGKINVEAGVGGSRTLQANIVNKGTLAIDRSTTFNTSKAVFTNEGSVTIASGAVFSFPSSNTINSNSGSFAASGTGYLVMSGGGDIFNQGAGDETGAPVYVEDGTLNYLGAGTATVDLRGVSSVSGNVGAGQLLTIESTCGKNALATWAKGFTNTSTITLTNADECGNSEELAVTEGTLLNEGKINVEAGVGGSRTLQANIVNKGTLAIDRSTTFNTSKAVFTNEGSVTIASGAVFSFPSSNTINSNSGSFAASGTGYLVMSGGGDIFNQGGGKETGEPVYIEDGALNFTGTAQSAFVLRGIVTMTGEVAKSDKVTIESTCGKNTEVNASTFKNSGAMILTNSGACGNEASILLGAGTLTNKGTITVEQSYGGVRKIEGSLTNEKTLTLVGEPTLKVTGSYTQTTKGSLKVPIASATSYGVIAASGSASIAGKLTLSQAKTFKATVGQSFPIITASSESGNFTKESSATVKKAVGVVLQADLPRKRRHARRHRSNGQRRPGIRRTRHRRQSQRKRLSGERHDQGLLHGRKKSEDDLRSVADNSAGEFSAEIAVPAGAALGAGKATGTSTIAGVSASATFTVN